jgi:hypothetical protein
MTISISQAKQIREQFGATHLVIFAIDPDGTQHVATHGLTEQNAQEAAKAGNKLKAALGWDDELCHARPLPRVCKNCTFFEKDYGVWCANGWSGDGSTGWCQLEPERVKVDAKGKCRHFEPNC